MLAECGFGGVIIENYGDVPFFPDAVPPVTVAAMTACALSVREAAPGLSLGINVLRNDAAAAVSIAHVAGAAFVRINVHSGARVTDQGLVTARAYETLRLRRSLGSNVALLCDVDVKHSSRLGGEGKQNIGDEASDLVERALADGVLVTGAGTGKESSVRDLEDVVARVQVPVWIASGVTADNLHQFDKAFGVIVGSTLRADGRAGGPIGQKQSAAFAERFFAR